MSGEATPAQIGGFLVALRLKGETADEIAGAAEAMRAHVLPVEPKREDLVDTAGTGRRRRQDVQHLDRRRARRRSGGRGRREARQPLGLVALRQRRRARGARLRARRSTPERIAQSIDELGFGFMFAPTHHPAMKHAGPVRRELAARTVFNVLGPLTNPAGARAQVVGVYSPQLVPVIADVLAKLGARRAFVVHGAGGIDELSPAGPNLVCEVVDGDVRRREIDPLDLGIERCDPDELRGGTPRRTREDPRGLRGRERRPPLGDRAQRRGRDRRGRACSRPRGRHRHRRRGARLRRGGAAPRRARRVLAGTGGGMRFAGALERPGSARSPSSSAARRRRATSARTATSRRSPARYEQSGARAMSVLVDERFGGILGRSARRARGDERCRSSRRASSRRPTISRRRATQARTRCCSCCATWTDATCAALIRAAGTLGLDTLVEAHDADEIDRALAARRAGDRRQRARPLDFSIDRREQLELLARAPRDRIVIAESGIATRAQAAAAELAGRERDPRRLDADARRRSGRQAARAALAPARQGVRADASGRRRRRRRGGRRHGRVHPRAPRARAAPTRCSTRPTPSCASRSSSARSRRPTRTSCSSTAARTATARATPCCCDAGEQVGTVVDLPWASDRRDAPGAREADCGTGDARRRPRCRQRRRRDRGRLAVGGRLGALDRASRRA